jgi:hypothetical protein
MISSANNINANLNNSKVATYNAYAINLYNKHDRTCIVSRYVIIHS